MATNYTETQTQENTFDEIRYDPNELITVVLVFPNGNKFNFQTLLGNTVKALKLSIEQSRIIPESQYFFTLEGGFLHDDWILGSVGVTNNTELIINRRVTLNISVQLENDTVKLQVTGDCLIGDLKKFVAPSFKTNPISLVLIFGEKECEDDRSLMELGVTDTSTILAKITEKVNVIVRYLSNDMSCVVPSHSTVKELKDALSQSIANDAENIKLHYNGKELYDVQTLLECDIKEDSIIEASLVIDGGF